MGLVDYEYYTEYMGEPIDGADFPRMEKKAERLIVQITHGRAKKAAQLPEVLQTAIKNAVCAQIEYYNLNGLDVAVTGETAADWTVGKVRVNSGARASATGSASMVCPAAIAELEQTGLLDPAVPVLDFPDVWEVILP